MSERELELLEVLAEKLPVRFGFGRDLDGEFFHDAENGGVSFYFRSPQFWIMRVSRRGRVLEGRGGPEGVKPTDRELGHEPLVAIHERPEAISFDLTIEVRQ